MAPEPTGFYDMQRGEYAPAPDLPFGLVKPREPAKKHPLSLDFAKRDPDSISNEELGRLIIALRYDKVVEVLRGMQKGIASEKEGDLARQRLRLAKLLRQAEDGMEAVIGIFEDISKLCAPYNDKADAAS